MHFINPNKFLCVISATPTSDIPAVPLVTRKIGVQGFYNSSKQNAGDIYQLAIAARKARERQPPGDYGYCNSSTVTPGYLPLKSHLSGSYSKSIHDFREFKTQDRASMLRTAYAAQRYDQPGVSFQSETTAFSLDSSADIFGNEEPDAENMLMQLGFGGPSQGFDRIPERFLQPSQVNKEWHTNQVSFKKFIDSIKISNLTFVLTATRGPHRPVFSNRTGIG